MTVEFNDVFKRELEDIGDRRSSQGVAGQDGLPNFTEPSGVLAGVLDKLKNDGGDAVWDSAKNKGPTKHTGLVGLALSGGGIRSATFNLGVLQILKKYGVFDRIDYLSTVSGGGYIGSCLSSVLAHGETFPFEHTTGQEEGRPFRHLRDYSNYLAPRGVLDLLRVPALLLRGVLINFLVVLPYILLAALITAIIKPSPENLTDHLLKNYWPFSELPGDSFLFTKLLVALFVVGLLLYPLGQYIFRKRNYFGISPWIVRERYGRNCGTAVIVIALVAFVELQPLAIDALATMVDTAKDGNGLRWLLNDQDAWMLLGAVGSFIASLFAGKLSVKASRWTGKAGIYLVAALGIFALWLIYLNLCRWAIIPQAAPGWVQPFEMNVLWFYTFVMIALWLYSMWFVDVNFTSLHNLYRDRLSKAYLFKWSGAGDLKHNDEQRLQDLDTSRNPYHLINAALNIQSAEEANRRGRNADFFIFSKHFIGGELTNYCETEKIEDLRKHVNLGTAMAISGAAVAPNMGTATIKPLVFIMAMLNVRLGYWLPNPRRIAGNLWRINNKLTQVGPIYLIRELLGRLDETSWNVNVSDGGHIENLGICELLRRECRLIIASDAECDRDLEFGGLAAAIRMARIDMGITIKMKGLEEIRNGNQHHAIGTIHYKDGKIGKLIYLKSSLINGSKLYDENTYIAHYKAKNPAFPHETTADQFFDETQFECYRALGYIVADSVFGT